MGVRCACPHHHTAVAALSHHPCHVLDSVLPISIAEQHKIASLSKNTRPQCRTVSSPLVMVYDQRYSMVSQHFSFISLAVVYNVDFLFMNICIQSSNGRLNSLFLVL